MGSFFTVDETGKLVLNREELRLIKEYRIILERDRGSIGDMDGRKKFMAFKEFRYIYEIADYVSHSNRAGLNEKDAHVYAFRESVLPDLWKPDHAIREAIERYRKDQEEETPSIVVLDSTIRALRTSNRVVRSISKNIETILDLSDKQAEQVTNSGSIINITDSTEQAKALTSQLSGLIDISNSIPKTLKVLEDLRAKVHQEEKNQQTLRGNKTKGLRADPKNK